MYKQVVYQDETLKYVNQSSRLNLKHDFVPKDGISKRHVIFLYTLVIVRAVLL